MYNVYIYIYTILSFKMQHQRRMNKNPLIRKGRKPQKSDTLPLKWGPQVDSIYKHAILIKY